MQNTNSLTFLSAVTAKKPEEKYSISNEAERQLREHVILNLMVEYYNFNSSDLGDNNQNQKEACLEILDDMIEDGICSFSCIDKFKEIIEERTKVSTESWNPTEDLASTNTLVDFCRKTMRRDLHNDEKKTIENFNDAMKTLQNATSQLTELFLPHVTDMTREIVNHYSGFSKEFVEKF